MKILNAASGFPPLVGLVIFCGMISSPVCGADPADLEHFEKKIRPLLIKHCYQCHSHQAQRLEANLSLDSRQGFLKGGDSGPVIVPGKPAESPLLEALRYETFEMPPRGKLPAEDIAAVSAWIQNGADWPDEAAPVAGSASPMFDWKQRRESHWSWQPIQNPAPPKHGNSDWPRCEVDDFVLSKLASNHLQPAPPADAAVWLRRVFFDLIGLPPSPEQLADFLADTRIDARARIVDELLASPHFGEHWARHWMDLVRYAETYGHEFDYSIPHASAYRDYLIRAFNADVPYDQLVREHLAGDLLRHPRRNPDDHTNESVIGTGFWLLGESVHAPTNVRADLSTRIENQIDVATRAFLGLSVACARCHDHKFDAISQSDYYALYGILNSSHRSEFWIDPHDRIKTAQIEIRELSESADRQLSTALGENAIRFREDAAKHLSAAGLILRELPDGPPSSTPQKNEVEDVSLQADLRQLIAQHASDLHLGVRKLSRWVSALRDTAALVPSHPVYPVRKLLKADVANFAKTRQQLSFEIETVNARAQAIRDDSLCFETFDTPQWNGWQTLGPAFGSGPHAGLHGRWSGSEWDIAIPGVAATTAISPRLRGTLRSPLFTLEHPQLHYRIRARNVTVRLVLENYYMDQYQALLFRGATRKNIDTHGEWVWITHAEDLKNHLGRRAYLEVLDDGDGFAEIDQIWFSSTTAPIDPPSQLARRFLDNPGITTRETLIDACSQQWSEVLATASRQELTADSTLLLNWLLKYQLLELPPQLSLLHKDIHQRAKSLPAPEAVLAFVDGPGLDEPIHIRGSDENFGDAIPRRFLLALGGDTQAAIASGSGRREWAQQLTNAENPLFSRVIVNRLWHHLFGRGIVPSVDDFGVMGQPPSHPELLDWLASDFQRKNYSMQQTLRMLVLSSTYQMSSYPQNDAAETADPENQWLHRMSVRRLPAESVRDAVLAISGRMDSRMTGPSVPVHLTEFMEGRGRPKVSGPLDGDGRRSVYLEIRRNFLSPLMLAFDMPSPFSCMGRRAVSNVPAQSLILMNDPLIVEQSRRCAEQLLDLSTAEDQRLDLMFVKILGRHPDQLEHAAAGQFLQEQAARYQCPADDPRVWEDLCHMLFNMKEFLFLR